MCFRPAHSSARRLMFVNTRTADCRGIRNDYLLRFGIDLSTKWEHSFALLHPHEHERKIRSSCLHTRRGSEHSYQVRSAKGDYRWFLTRMEALLEAIYCGGLGQLPSYRRAQCAYRGRRMKAQRDARSACRRGQQVVLNLILIVNSIQAIGRIGEGPCELQISIDAVPKRENK